MGCYFGLFKPRDEAETLDKITANLTVAIDRLLDKPIEYPYLAAPSEHDDIPPKTLNRFVITENFEHFLKAYEDLSRALLTLKPTNFSVKRRGKQLNQTLVNIGSTLNTVLKEKSSIDKPSLKDLLVHLSNHVEMQLNKKFEIHPKLRTALYVAVATLAFAALITTLVLLPFVHLAILPAVAIAVGALIVTGGTGCGYYHSTKNKAKELNEAKTSIKDKVDDFLDKTRKMIV